MVLLLTFSKIHTWYFSSILDVLWRSVLFLLKAMGKGSHCRYFLWKLKVSAQSVCTYCSSTGLWEVVKVEEYLSKAATAQIDPGL